MILLDLFCGRWGWSRAFAKRGWHCIGVDLREPPLPIPHNCEFVQIDVLEIERIGKCGACGEYCECPHSALHQRFDAIVASSPCEEFSKTTKGGMSCFYPNAPYPEMGIKLFNHARSICEKSGLLYVLENVRGAEKWVGNSKHHAGPFHLWGNAVPLLLPKGITKGTTHMGNWNHNEKLCPQKSSSELAQIPSELANCVAEFMERILERREV